MRTLLLRRPILGCFAVASVVAGSVFLVIVVNTKSEQIAMEECGKHLRDLSLAIDAHRSLRGHFPPGAIIDEKLPPEKRWSWFAILWNYLDGNPPGIPDQSLPWDARENLYLTYFDTSR